MRKEGRFAACYAILPKIFAGLLFLLSSISLYAQPANDNCANASVVTMSAGGFGTGIFTSSTFDLTSATVQGGETFAPAILVAGQNQKSIWYKFSIPTTRTVKVSLWQPGSLITAGDAGFAVYKSNTCLPAGIDISTKLTPIGVFGNSFHPCVDPGDYLVQVSSKATANGPVYITVETGQPTAAYDLPAQANYFGVLPPHANSTALNFTVDCQTIDNASEVCNTLGNYQNYTKSTWHVFTTPAYLDYLTVQITGGFTVAGFKLYQGDVRSSPYSSMPVIKSCDSINGLKTFNCGDLNPNTTYSIELFFDKNYQGNVNILFFTGGFAPTIAPEPILSAISPTTNNLGVLPSSPTGVTTGRNDFLACNSRISLHPCSPSLPAGGYTWGGQNWNLSSFFMFTLSGSSNVSFNVANSNPAGSCGNNLLIRIYKQKVTNVCSDLNTSNIISEFIATGNISCMPAGDYTMQVMGLDSTLGGGGYYCTRNNLGTIFDMNINVQSINATNKFNLSAAGAFDTLNRVGGIMQPMVPGVTYTSLQDTLGCNNTVLPLDAADANCVPGKTKAIYREFIVPDSGIVSMWSGGSPGGLNYKIYKGDANALAIAQSAFAFPSTISGLTPVTLCLNNTSPAPYACDYDKVCLLPGTYTEVVFGNNTQVGNTNQFKARFDIVNTSHYDLANAEDMGDILSIIPPTGGSVTSSADYYSCKDNALVIDGFQPCKGGYGSPGTKAIYRQFYLSSPASINVASVPVGCDYTPFTLFSGKATNGIAGLKVMPAPWQCTTGVNGVICSPLPAGWYTIVSYGWGPSYQSPTRNVNDVYYGYTQYSSMVGFGNKITISLNVPNCPLPKYNRPYKAAIDTVTKQPFLIQWGPRAGNTSAYPKTDTTYILYTENFLCDDTPFIKHPIQVCNPTMTKVAYYVFKTTQESFIKINSTWWATVYAGDVRTDSALYATQAPIQPCISDAGQTQICKLLPGTYTLAIFAQPSASCTSITPSIYIDKVGYSRFDHANNAYDFGTVPADSIWYNGKVGDINPLDPGRAPSSDIFYCTTGSQPNDPAYYCYSTYMSSIYNAGNNNPLYTSNIFTGMFGNIALYPRRNLWYTFVVDKGGWVRVRVNNKTIGKMEQYPFFVMRSDVNGTLPFSTVVSTGGVDSTAAQGLIGVAENAGSGQTCQGGSEVSFYRATCSPIPERYYIIVQDPASGQLLPNHQVEVSILFDSVNAIQPKFDHYYQASNIGNNLGPGSYTGATDNFSCATKDATEPFYDNYHTSNCNKTLWYKFSTTVSGVISPSVYIFERGSVYGYEFDQSRILLYREIIPGDSTSNGLQLINTQSGSSCITPGTYYLIIQNCDLTSGTEYPQITITENIGDYCSKPIIANLNGAGTSVSSATVNCHTIGTDYGEFNPTLTCPAGAITNQYKSSWFKINITGTDTLDVTTYLTENTNAASSQIKYRLMNGDCNAMQERSCVQDALTQDTYKCLAPGSYWVQVFTPVTVSGAQTVGTIDLHLNAIKHADTCAPINNCLSNANFQKQFDCTQSTAVQFINYSTYGASVSYQWDFGYAGKTSTAVSPSFVYPSLATSQKYYITLKVTNNTCGGISTYKDSITIPARPVVNIGTDTSLCSGGSLTLNATSFAGSTYQWNTGANTATILVSQPGVNYYNVAVTYNGCIARDTIKVTIDTITPRKLTKYLCGSDPVNLNAYRGVGEYYTWNTGASSSAINIYNTGTYWCDVISNGCVTRDSFIVSTTASPLGSDRAVCFAKPYTLNATTTGANSYSWQNGSTGATFNATAPGLYWVDIVFGNCTFRDTVVLSTIAPATATLNPKICQGQFYTFPSGVTKNIAGTYKDTLRTVQGCDSVINTINLTVQAVTTQSINPAICKGQTYTLPWGTVVNIAGTYRDTLRYITGCDSIRRAVTLTVQSPSSFTITTSICSGQSYILPWGQAATASGIYNDTLRYSTGCDSLYRTVNLTVQPNSTVTTNTTICSGQTYTLPWGKVVNAAGVYRDTLRYKITNCDSLYRIINLTVQSSTTITSNPKICSGQAYTLPWGTVVNTAGTYRDTLRYKITNCDSVYRIVNLIVQSPASSVINAGICSGQSYTLPWGQVVSSPGTYKDTLHYTAGCDSLYRTVIITQQTAQSQMINGVICSGKSYLLPWGTTVSVAGTYKDTLRYGTGCDSLYRTVNLIVQSVQTVIKKDTICAGQSFMLPWGQVVNSAGIYRDTIRYTTGCDSLYRIEELTVQSSATSQTTNAVICSGQAYTLPSGIIVSSTGTYTDTLRFKSGCDSLYRIVNLLVQSPSTISLSPVICSGQAYTLPWGVTVSTAGIYKDTLHYKTGCDSLYRIVTLTVQTKLTSTTNAVICSGQSYILPWGTIVNASGTYRDTLHYSTGCDSLYRIINLTVQSPSTIFLSPVVCSGQTYTLPWGTTVNAAGTYRDTLHYTTGCDSIYRIVSLTVQNTLSQSINAQICSGSAYTLPWGVMVSTAGVYRDTLHFKSGCDSLYRTVNLAIQPLQTVNIKDTICSGQFYTLPWGTKVNAAGIYRDTIRYQSGCDSLYSIINLLVQSPAATVNTRPVICLGQSYTLPWGTKVSAAGTYKDTVYYQSGCDSLYRIVNLTVQSPSSNTLSPVICANQTYTLPWGVKVNISGIYKDTLHYPSGCDSLYRTVNLTVKPSFSSVINQTICAGQSYTLPWGVTVNKSGTYKDTLRYTSGCDSLYRIVNLTVQPVVNTVTNPSICAGQSYILPWGVAVNVNGIYKDTLHYSSGCDSLYRTVNLLVQTVQTQPVVKADICYGSTYILPWGKAINVSGVYRDTLHYSNTGCDSVRREVDLTVLSSNTIVTNATICQGQSYLLPWGTMVNISGIYRDTLRYKITNCDSVYRIISLSVTPAQISSVNAAICSGEFYVLPSGKTASVTGIYRDTVRTVFGCDSLIRSVNLTVSPRPLVKLSKSNDINCVVGVAKLTATGGTSYQWSPSVSLSNPYISNPSAFPSTTTVYKVKVANATGCTAEDSIKVVVTTDGLNEAFPVPNSFTPNGDGLNDCFGVKHWGNVTNLKLEVFNRWGERLFSTTNVNECWDGTYKGIQQPSAVYVYRATAETICGKISREGTVTLIR